MKLKTFSPNSYRQGRGQGQRSIINNKDFEKFYQTVQAKNNEI